MPAVVEFDTTAQLFRNLAVHFDGQERIALSYMDRRTREWIPITWEDLIGRVEKMASYLYQEGVRPGDRVAILSENRPEWAITDMATQFLGAVNVSLYTSLPPSQVEYILKDSESSVLVVSTGIQLKKAEEVFDQCPALRRVVTMSELRKDHPEYVRSWDQAMEAGRASIDDQRSRIHDLSDAIRPDDLSALIYTSGTTGFPKGVMLSHRNFCSNIASALGIVPFGPGDHHLSFLPLCHSFERTAGYMCVLACGARITYAQSTDTVSRDLPDVRPTVLISVPRLFERVYNTIFRSVESGPSYRKRIFEWSVATGRKFAVATLNGGPGPFLRAKQRLADRLVFAKLHEKLGGNLRFAVSGGAALPRVVGEFFHAAGVTIIEGYGLTETSPVLTVSPIERPRFGMVGHVLPGVTVGIQDLQSGEIHGRLSGEDYPTDLSTDEGEIIARGPNIMRGYWKNEESTREVIDESGWYHTGDVGRFDEGYLVITDRIKHMIVSKGGKNIYPGPIEEVFKTEGLIEQIMVVGEGRAFLTALVVPAESADDLSAAGDRESVDLAALEESLTQVFREYSKRAAAHEKIRDFRIIGEPFTVDNGMMTPTLKLRRRMIESEYADLIDSMYADVI